jgi:hypothetical protein
MGSLALGIGDKRQKESSFHYLCRLHESLGIELLRSYQSIINCKLYQASPSAATHGQLTISMYLFPSETPKYVRVPIATASITIYVQLPS